MAEDTTQRDALARSICARLCDARRSESELRSIDRELIRIEREAREPGFKVYVAAASSDMARVRIAIALLTSAGIEVVCTWPGIVTKVGDANPRDATREARFGWSSQDLAEVDEADALWFLVPDNATTRGAWVEAGVAFCTAKHLVFSGDTKQSVFCALGEEFATDDDALAYLVRVARDRAALRQPVPSPTRSGDVIAALREFRDSAWPFTFDESDTRVVDETDITAEVEKR